jgi:hypothetical protein
VLAAGAALIVAGLTAWIGDPAYSQTAKPAQRPPAAPAPVPAPAHPGVPASAQTIAELRRAVADAVARLQARDTDGVLAHVSDRYRTSPLTKPLLHDQLVALFGLYDALQAQVRIDEVRMVGGNAWFWSSGDVTGRLAVVGRWMPVFRWERELEVARRENGRWLLYGYQR